MDNEAAMKLSKKTDFLMSCQERTGVCFDADKAVQLHAYCVEEMLNIEHEVEPQLVSDASYARQIGLSLF